MKLDLELHNPAGIPTPPPGLRILRKCELPDIANKRNASGLRFYCKEIPQADGSPVYINSASTFVSPNPEKGGLTYVPSHPFGYYGGSEQPPSTIQPPSGYRFLTKLERAHLDGRAPRQHLQRCMFMADWGHTPAEIRWGYNRFTESDARRHTTRTVVPGCGSGGIVVAPLNWDIFSEVIELEDSAVDPVPAPDPSPVSVHNPQRLPGPGEGYRFLTTEEFDTAAARFGSTDDDPYGDFAGLTSLPIPGLQFWDGGWCWTDGSPCFLDPDVTHRVPNGWVLPNRPPASMGAEGLCPPSVFGSEKEPAAGTEPSPDEARLQLIRERLSRFAAALRDGGVVGLVDLEQVINDIAEVIDDPDIPVFDLRITNKTDDND